MTEKEMMDYGQDVHELYSTENPATYTPKASVSYFIYHGFPARLVKIEDFKPRSVEPRPVLMASSRTEYSKKFPGWHTLVTLLQRWIPRSLI